MTTERRVLALTLPPGLNDVAGEPARVPARAKPRRFRAARPIVAALFLGAAMLPRTARAEGVAQEAGSLERAREHFARGVSFYKAGSLDAALAEFNRAYEIRPNFQVLYNIGQVQAERQDHVAAIKAFQRYLADGGAEISPERRAAVDENLHTQFGRVGELLVKINAQDGELLVDGVVVSPLPLSGPVQVNAGIREIGVRVGGRAAAPRRVTVTGGETIRLDFQVDSALAAQLAPAAPAPVVASSGGLPARAWVAYAAAGLFAGGAVVTGLTARKANSNLDNDLARFPGDRGQIDNDRSRVRLFAGVTDGLAAAALVSAGLGIYFTLARSSGDAKGGAATGARKASADGAAPAELRLLAAGSGVVLTGAF